MQTKHYYKIGEVCKITDLKPSVLRFWEREFKQLKPVKSNSRHRFYTQKHVTLINTLKHLLYEEKLTIEGAKLKLKEEFTFEENSDSKEIYTLKQIKEELENLLNSLKNS
jgi:DNA-binding transcriptional MerR regulator